MLASTTPLPNNGDPPNEMIIRIGPQTFTKKTMRVSSHEELKFELAKNIYGYFPLHIPHKLQMASSW
jgi:hypothetical protein